MRRPYDATQAYAVSKLANVLHTRELAARLQVETVPLSLDLHLPTTTILS
jgi:hypothetical protein